VRTVGPHHDRMGVAGLAAVVVVERFESVLGVAGDELRAVEDDDDVVGGEKEGT
jgi:hypothetical protein